jgi:Baseplate J-like protein
MAISLDDLTTPLSVDDVTESIYNVLAALGVNTATWKPGAVVRTIIAAAAVVLSAFSELMALIAKSGWLELAEGNWLKLVAIHVFGIDEASLEATFAAGQVTLTNTGGGVFGPFAPGDVVVKNTTTGKTYRNTEAFSLAALGTATFGIEAIEAGAASTSAPGAIDALVTTMIGVTVSNAASVVGTDDLSDTAVRTLCLEKRSALSPNGPRDAYAFFARTAKRTDGTLVGVSRVHVTSSSTTGFVTVTVAGPSGAISGTATDPTTDLGAVDSAIKQNVVPDAVTEVTQSANPAVIGLSYDLWIYTDANLTDQQVRDLVTAEWASFMVTQPIGGNVIAPAPGKVFVDAIRAAVGSVRPEIFHVVISSPASDVVLGDADVPMPGAITTANIHQVVRT